ncbi:MAG: hypothetical protein ACR2J4_08305, partial [Deinococcus sp.]
MTLRTRLTLLYTALLSLLLLLLALAVLTVMGNSLLGGVSTTLRDAYGQFSNLAEQLGIRPFTVSGPVDNAVGRLPGSSPFQDSEAQNSFQQVRQNFPGYRVQFEPLVGNDVQQLEVQAEGDGAQRQALLSSLRRKQALYRRTPGLDPNAPIELSDAQLLRLLSVPDHELLLTIPVKDIGTPAVPTRVLVKLTNFVYGRNLDNSRKEVLTIVYFGRSLQETLQT